MDARVTPAHDDYANPALADDRQRDRSKPRKADGAGPGGGEIDHPAANERAAVVDAHDDRAAVAPVGDPHPRAERQAAMCGGEASRIGALTVCGLATGMAVMRCNTRLRRGFRRRETSQCE